MNAASGVLPASPLMAVFRLGPTAPVAPAWDSVWQPAQPAEVQTSAAVRTLIICAAHFTSLFRTGSRFGDYPKQGMFGAPSNDDVVTVCSTDATSRPSCTASG